MLFKRFKNILMLFNKIEIFLFIFTILNIIMEEA
jgi:hypothetical protein